MDRSDKRWVIDELEPHVAIRLKQLFTGIARSQIVPFYFDDTPRMATDLDWFMSRYPLSISTKDQGRLKRQRRSHHQSIDKIEHFFSKDYVPPKIEFKQGLAARDYQSRGKQIILNKKRIFCGDELGIGKTVQAISCFTDPSTLPALIVVQTHLPEQWRDEIERFTTLRVHLINGRQPYRLPESDIYIAKYSILSGWVDVFVRQNPIRMVVFDEMQELRRHQSQKYKAAKQITAETEYVLGLSHSPIYNYGEEIFNIMKLINPDVLGDRTAFEREWCKYGKMVKDPKALGTYLREQHVFFRRTRADVGRELPPINQIVHTVPHDHQAVEQEQDLRRSLAMQVLEGNFHESGQAAREFDMRLRQITGVGKARAVAEYVKLLLDSGEPVLLSGWHREVYTIWLEELGKYYPAMYTGSESAVQKRESKRRFIEGETNLMIISNRSGIGIDGLQKRCRYVVIGELDWSPKVHEQLIGRVDRDGQPDQVTALYLVTDYGSDPHILDMLGLKQAQSHGIVDPLNAPKMKENDISRIKKMAQDYLNKI